MPTKRVTDPLTPGKLYHIYNRGINKNKIFFTEANYRYFIEKYKKYMDDWVHTYCYCFIPNHFHLLVQIKDELPNCHNTCGTSEQFRRLFSSYAMSINKQENRKGSLFQRPFRRAVVKSSWHLKRLVYYIHNNPVKHYLTNDFTTFKYSSYQDILQNNNTIIDPQVVLSWFNDLEEFIEYHSYLSEQ